MDYSDWKSILNSHPASKSLKIHSGRNYSNSFTGRKIEWSLKHTS